MQPARFIVARRGGGSFAKIHETLMGFNRAWADAASVLIVNVATLPLDANRENPWARYDLGQAVAHLTIQAQHEGLHTHQLGGFDSADTVTPQPRQVKMSSNYFSRPSVRALSGVTTGGDHDDHTHP